jgi:hypothetical protein
VAVELIDPNRLRLDYYTDDLKSVRLTVTLTRKTAHRSRNGVRRRFPPRNASAVIVEASDEPAGIAATSQRGGRRPAPRRPLEGRVMLLA